MPTLSDPLFRLAFTAQRANLEKAVSEYQVTVCEYRKRNENKNCVATKPAALMKYSQLISPSFVVSDVTRLLDVLILSTCTPSNILVAPTITVKMTCQFWSIFL